MNKYVCLKQQEYISNEYKLVPIRYQDRFDIMKWRNEQMYHLRQSNELTIADQEVYFKKVINANKKNSFPDFLLFSFLRNEKLIGYGGLVHINWVDKNAEISFLINTELEKQNFEFYWIAYLNLIEILAFTELNFHKIYTYAYDVRPKLYSILKKCKYKKEAILIDHVIINGKYKNVLIHSKIN